MNFINHINMMNSININIIRAFRHSRLSKTYEKNLKLGLSIPYWLTFKSLIDLEEKEEDDDSIFYDYFVENFIDFRKIKSKKVPKNMGFMYYFINYYYLIKLDEIVNNDDPYLFSFFFLSCGFVQKNVIQHIKIENFNVWKKYFLQDIPKKYKKRKTNGICFKEWIDKFFDIAEKRMADNFDFWFNVQQDANSFLSFNFNSEKDELSFLNVYNLEIEDLKKISIEILECEDRSKFVSNDSKINKIIETFDVDFLNFCNAYKKYNHQNNSDFSWKFNSLFLGWYDLSLDEMETNWNELKTMFHDLLSNTLNNALEELNIYKENDEGDLVLNSYFFFIFSLLFLLKEKTRENFIHDWKHFLNELVKFEVYKSTENDLELSTIKEFKEDDYKGTSIIYAHSLENKINKKEFSMFKKSLYSLEIDEIINKENYKDYEKEWDSDKFVDTEKSDLKKFFHSTLIGFELGISTDPKKRKKNKIAITVLSIFLFLINLTLCFLPLMLR